MEAIFMGAITWAIIGICYMIYSEFQGSDKMFNRRLLQATSGGDIPIPVDVPTACFVPSRNQYNAQNHVEYMPTFTIPENVTRLGLYWHPVQTAYAYNCKLWRQVVAVSEGQRYRVDYFNWSTNATSATATLRLTNVDNGRTLDTAGSIIAFDRYIWEQTMKVGVFFFPCKILYCGYNREIEKLPITASIA